MAAMARKARLVSDIILCLLTEQQVEFGDQPLYFKELICELEHPFYPEVLIDWHDNEANLLSVTNTVGDYSLHEPPILEKKRVAVTNENPAPAAARVMELLSQYVSLHSHERNGACLCPGPVSLQCFRGSSYLNYSGASLNMRSEIPTLFTPGD